jgi:hypothetical protein
MKTYKVELIVKIQEESYPDKWLADAVYELLEPENGEQIVKYRVTELIYLESEIPHAPAQGVRYTPSNKTDIRETWKRFGWTPTEDK